MDLVAYLTSRISSSSVGWLDPTEQACQNIIRKQLLFIWVCSSLEAHGKDTVNFEEFAQIYQSRG